MDVERVRVALAAMTAMEFPDWSEDDALDDLLGDIREADAYLAGRASSAIAAGRLVPDEHDDLSELGARLDRLSRAGDPAVLAPVAQYLRVMNGVLDALYGR